MFGVNFADGRIKGYPAGSARPGRPSKGYYVFYVRGNTEYGKNDFHDNGDGSVSGDELPQGNRPGATGEPPGNRRPGVPAQGSAPRRQGRRPPAPASKRRRMQRTPTMTSVPARPGKSSHPVLCSSWPTISSSSLPGDGQNTRKTKGKRRLPLHWQIVQNRVKSRRIQGN
jgi:hypothetical protein